MTFLILVIDDSPHQAGLVRAVLKKIGTAAEVVTARTGEEGLESLQGLHPANRLFRPDLIILDQIMPGMSGTDVLRELRRNRALSDIPVLHWSSDAELDACTAFRIEACGRKPATLDEYCRLFEMLTAILASRRLGKAA